LRDISSIAAKLDKRVWFSRLGGDVEMDTLVHEPRKFCRIVSDLCDALDEEADDFLDKLSGVMEALGAYKWDDTLPITPYHGGGYKHQCPIDKEFILVFEKRIERDRAGLPLHVHLDLLGIERLSTSGILK
jgi:hypothetical protein